MVKYISLLAFIAVCALSASAQKTLIYETDPLFKKGLELYDKQHYNNAIRQFEQYVSVTTDAMALAECRFYIASSKLKMEHANALNEMLSYLEQYPDSRKANMGNKQVADYYYYNKKYKTALQYYKKVNISAFSAEETDDILFNKGFCLFKAEKYEEAKEALYPLTLQHNDNTVKATYYYGYVCYMNKNYHEALKAFLNIEDKGPQTMKLYICQIYYLDGDYQKAIDYANKINLGKLNGKRDLVKGKSYYKLKDFKNAQTYFETAEYNTDSMSEEEIYEIGYTYYANQNCTKSFSLFEKIASNGTALAQSASYHLGDCFVKTNQKQNAYNAFYEAQRSNFDPYIKEESMFNYGKLAYELTYTGKAIATFQKFIEAYPKSSHINEARKHLASLFLNSNDYKTAVTVLENMTDMDEETRAVYQKITYYRGEELVINKDWQAASAMFERSMANRSDELIYGLCQYWTGEVDYRNNKLDAARGHYQKFIDIPESKSSKYYPQALYAMGYTFYAQKKYSEAAGYFNNFKSLGAKYTIDKSLFYDATMRLGDCYYTLKSYPEALDAYSYITSNRAPGSDYAMFQQGMIYGLQGKSANKINTMKKISRDFPNSTYIADGIFETAEEYMQDENYIEAERSYRYLIEDYPNSVYVRRCYMSLGQLYRNQNKDNDAISTYKIVVSKYAGSDESKDAMRYIKDIYVENGNADDYIKWAETIPNSGIKYSTKDSLNFTSAYNRYLKGDCASSVGGLDKYNADFPSGFFQYAAHYYAAGCYEDMKNTDLAIRNYQYVADGNDNEFKVECIEHLSALYFQQKQYTEALKYYGLLESYSNDPETRKKALLGQMRSAFALGENETAKNKADQLLKYDQLTSEDIGEANNTMGKIALSYFSIDKDNAAKSARGYFNKTLKTHQDIYGAEAKYYIGEILYMQDSLDRCKKNIMEFNQQFASYDYWLGKTFILLADYYIKKGDKFQAKATLNSVLENYEYPDIVESAKQKLEAIEPSKTKSESNEE